MKHIAGTIFTIVLLSAGTNVAWADGKAVYQQSCAACHSDGITGAPKLGDKNAWAPLIAKGRNSLIGYALNGPGHVTWDNEAIPLGKMPAKGGTKDLTVEEVTAAVDYMIAGSRQDSN
jgi:cytochrome c5